jgi:hypothetical protein
MFLKIAFFLGVLEPDAAPARLSTKFQIMSAATIALFCGKISDVVWAGLAGGYMTARLIKGAIEKKNGKTTEVG